MKTVNRVVIEMLILTVFMVPVTAVSVYSLSQPPHGWQDVLVVLTIAFLVYAYIGAMKAALSLIEAIIEGRELKAVHDKLVELRDSMEKKDGKK